MGKHGVDPEKNPLGFLDRLLDKERNSLNFGDVRFWKHIEYIDTMEIYNSNSIEYKSMKLMFCECIFYIIFLSFLTAYVVELRSRDIYDLQKQQFEYWSECKNRPLSVESVYVTEGCSAFDVKNVKDISPWIRDYFIPKAFTGNELIPKLVESSSIFRLHQGTNAWEPRYIGDAETTVLVGAIRLRQLRTQRIKADDCGFLESLRDTVQDACYPAFSPSVESKKPWAPTWTPSHLLHHYNYSAANETFQTTMAGMHGTYPGSGFFFDIPYNKSGAITRLMELEAWSWIDHRTRAVILEWTTLNINVNIMVHNRLLFEIPATGGVSARMDVFPLKVNQLSMAVLATDNEWLFRLMIITSGLHLLLFIYVVWLIYRNGLRYFTYLWNFFDLVILTVFFVMMCIHLAVYLKAGDEPYLAPETFADPEMFCPIGRLVDDLKMGVDALAVLGLVAWFRVLKYFTLVAWFHPFVRVIERTIYQLILFAGLLFLVLFGFALAFHMGYGGQTDLFATIGGSFIACIVAPAGGINFDPILKNGDFLGAVLVFMYVILIVFLLLSTFMAIVVDTYSVTNFQIHETMHLSANTPSATFWWTYFNALRNTKLVGKEKEEEKGSNEEQQILLSSLPEAISSRYLETKARMLGIKAEAEYDMKQEQLRKDREAGRIDDDVLPLMDPQPSAQNAQTRMLAIDDEMPPPPMGSPPRQPRLTRGASLEYEEDLTSTHVDRVQLQRMLNEDEILREICDTDKAIDIVRRFRVDEADIDPYEAVAKLQQEVSKKIEELEKMQKGPTVDELDTLKTVSAELHHALTESQKEWRSELLSVMQMASLLSRSLVELTRKMEIVQKNHNNLTTMIPPR